MLNASEIIEEDWINECEISLLDLPWIRYPFMIFYLFVFIVCTTGNVFTILVIIIHPLMRTTTNFFLANLAVADCLVSLFCILQNMLHIFGFENGHWPLGEFMCQMYVMVLHLFPCTSIGILICVSVEKYIAVLHPLLAMKILTQRLRYIVTISIWIASFLMNIVFFFNTKLYTWGGQSACARGGEMRWWTTLSFVVWYVIPLIALAYIYTRIGLLLWQTGGGSSVRRVNRQSSDSQGSTGASWHMANGRVIVYQQESLLQVPEDPQFKRRPRDLMEGRRKVVRLLFAVVLSFAVLSFPHHARLLETAWSTTPACNSDWEILLQPLSYLCLFVSSAINPILYAFMSRRFREAVGDILWCRKGVLSRLSRSRTRTLISDVVEDSRTPSPSNAHPLNNLRMTRMR